MTENARNIRFPVHFFMQFYAQLDIPSMFQVLGVFGNFVSQHFNAHFSTLIRSCLSYFAQVQFIFYFNQSITFIIPALTSFLQMKYPNKSPFATHPRAMRVAVSSSIIYYLAYIALLRYPLHRFAVIANHCLVSFGYASIASLASVLLPESLSLFVYAAFLLLVATELLYWLYHKLVAEDDDTEFHVQRRRFRRFLNNVRRVQQWAQILPI